MATSSPAMFATWLTQHASSPPRFGEPVALAEGPLAPLYRAFDGQLDGPPLVGSHRLLTLHDARAEKRGMDELAVAEGWDAAWWSPDWHPFASDQAGQLLVVDASTGRVLEFLHDDDARPELAPSLDRLFERLWAALHAGHVVYDAELGIDTPDALARRRRARAERRTVPPKPTPRPHAALALGLIPTFATLALGLAFEIDAGTAAIAATAVALAMAGVSWCLGWVVL